MNKILTTLLLTSVLCANAAALTNWGNYDTSGDATWQRHQDKVAVWAADRDKQQSEAFASSAADRQRAQDMRDTERMVDRKIDYDRWEQDYKRATRSTQVSDFKSPYEAPKQTPMLSSIWLIVMVALVVVWRRR